MYLFHNDYHVKKLLGILILSFFWCNLSLANNLKVIDGDTIVLNGEKIRFSGIDTPELKQTCLQNDVEVDCGISAKILLVKKIGNNTPQCIREGKDILFVTTGETAQRVLLASEILEKEEIFCSHINLHTIKPFDNDLFLNSLSKVKAIISVEEHSESGGLGEKCASLISQNNIQIPFKIIGFPDEYMINGSQSDVLDHYNMSPEKLAKIAKDLMN